jgi:hypothetical protein
VEWLSVMPKPVHPLLSRYSVTLPHCFFSLAVLSIVMLQRWFLLSPVEGGSVATHA